MHRVMGALHRLSILEKGPGVERAVLMFLQDALAMSTVCQGCHASGSHSEVNQALTMGREPRQAVCCPGAMCGEAVVTGWACWAAPSDAGQVSVQRGAGGSSLQASPHQMERCSWAQNPQEGKSQHRHLEFWDHPGCQYTLHLQQAVAPAWSS